MRIVDVKAGEPILGHARTFQLHRGGNFTEPNKGKPYRLSIRAYASMPPFIYTSCLRLCTAQCKAHALTPKQIDENPIKIQIEDEISDLTTQHSKIQVIPLLGTFPALPSYLREPEHI